MSIPPKRRSLLLRSDLRFSLAAGLTNAFATLSGIPYGYYATLAVLSSMSSSYGSSMELGRQRVLGTLLGTLVLLICYRGLAGLPFPLGIAVALGLQRLLGGLLRLQVGYKVGGVVIVMGWLVHHDQFEQWLPLRLFWTVFGIVIALLSMRLLWPVSAVADGWPGWARLLAALAQGLRQIASITTGASVDPMTSVTPLRLSLMGLRASLPAVRDELGGPSSDHPLLALLACLDESCSRLLGLLTGLQRAGPHGPSAPLQVVREAEAGLLVAVPGRLQLWAEALGRPQPAGHRGAPRPPAEPFAAPQAWVEVEQWLADPEVNRAALEDLERLAVRQQLCRQLLAALQRTEQTWRRCSA